VEKIGTLAHGKNCTGRRQYQTQEFKIDGMERETRFGIIAG
jgi:hypothetical protein